MSEIPPWVPRIGAVRGAISVERDEPAAIRAATARLLATLAAVNRLTPDRIVSALFTSTPDLASDFPAHSARLLGWGEVPLLGAQEVAVPGAPPRIVRVLVTVRGLGPDERLVPVYLDEATRLRPDLTDARASDATAATDATPDARPRATVDTARDQDDARRIAIVGLGQIGGSIGLALGGSPGWTRVGFDARPEVIEAARVLGAIDVAAESLRVACAGAALAVVATPVDTLPAVIAAVAAALPRGAALLDTGSARATLTPALEAAARRGIAAVGGHPLAGNEGHGLAAARPDLFAGATFVLCPVADAIPPVVARLVERIGAHAMRIDPAAHDRALARTSHLPYLVSCGLAALGADPAAAGLAGPGYRGMTRLAGSDPRMAGAYCHANATEVRAAWEALRVWLDGAVGALGEG
ncbi:MAG: chorismate mutase [Candidatus Eisenbacteria bacterium]